MITMNNVIAFIQEAMNKKLEIQLMTNYISIISNREDHFDIIFEIIPLKDNKEKLIFYIDSYAHKNAYKIVVENTEDILEWKLFFERSIKTYYHKCIENKFNNFFKGDCNKSVDINDLDDEDDK